METNTQQAEAKPDGLRIWSKVEATNPEFTKGFKRSGGFSGTAICPTYRAKQATEVFGPIGIGWGYEELQHRLEGIETSKMWMVQVKFWYIDPTTGKRGEITQWGSTEFVGTNKYGTFVDEEAPKKSVTDAWTKCLTLLGFSADVHLGKFDDNKYVQEVRERFRDKVDGRKQQQPQGGEPNGRTGNGHHNGNGRPQPPTNGTVSGNTIGGQPALTPEDQAREQAAALEFRTISEQMIKAKDAETVGGLMQSAAASPTLNAAQKRKIEINGQGKLKALERQHSRN